MKASQATSERSGRAVSAAFLLGVVGALLIVAGALLPQLSVPGHVTGPLIDPLAPAFDAGAMVVVFALFCIAFCLVGRYRWLMFCAVMIVLFLAVALTRQLTDMLGLTISQIIDMHNGVLPPDVDPSALLAKVPVLQATTYDDGLLVLAVGLLMIELAPWLRRLRFPPEKRSGGWTEVRRREPKAVKEAPVVVQAVAPATTPSPNGAQAPTAPPDFLLDDLYIFAEGLDQPLSFALLEPAGRITRHRVRLEAAGYLGDAYYLRCRDSDAGNLRDVPAHMMSEIVDGNTGAAIDTDDMLQDLARVAYEAVSDELSGNDQEFEDHAPTLDNTADSDAARDPSAPRGAG